MVARVGLVTHRYEETTLLFWDTSTLTGILPCVWSWWTFRVSALWDYSFLRANQVSWTWGRRWVPAGRDIVGQDSKAVAKKSFEQEVADWLEARRAKVGEAAECK